jgi:hypothetical protein
LINTKDTLGWTSNDWADYWRYLIGVNVIPADTQYRQQFPSWLEWQDKPVSEDQHEIWKKRKAFEKGMAIYPGKVWHREDKKDLYLVCLDLDNQKAIDEVCELFRVKDLKELSKFLIVEQHPDDPSRAHLYFYSTYVFSKKSSDLYKFKKEIENNQIPSIEVKGLGKHGISFCCNSKHKNGCRYEIDFLTEPHVFGKEIEDKLFDVYRKYDLQVGKNGQIPIEKLFQEDFVICEGHNRSEALLRVIESWLIKDLGKMSLAQIKQRALKYNLKHFNPPLDQKKFENQWKDAQNFVERKTKNSIRSFDNDKCIISKVVDHGLNPKVYYIDTNKREIRYGFQTVDGLLPKKSIMDIYPKKIFIHNNALFPKISQISIEFSNELKIGPVNNVSDIIKELENKGHILNKLKASDALNSIISAIKDKGLVEIINDVTTSGYYLINNYIVGKNVTQNVDVRKEDIINCCNYLNKLADYGWKDKDIFPTVLKWGLISPFSFIIKYNSNSENWMPWLQLYGHSQTGKTTLGKIVFSIWNQNIKDHSIGFNHMDSIARFGNVISKNTYPKLVNEIGALSNNSYGKYTNIIEIIKHSVESITVRGKFMNNNNNSYQDIPALSSMIFTSNHQPITDSGFNRRFWSIHFPESEKKDDEQQTRFKKLYEENNAFLKTLGDFAAWYLDQNPGKLLQLSWNELGKEILQTFYRFAKLESPQWIDYFVEQRDAVDESNELTHFGLRAFLLNKVNDLYSRYFNLNRLESGEGIDLTPVSDKVKYCLNNNLISFLHQNDKDTMLITVDLMKELRNNNIENIASLKDVGTLLQLKYTYKNFGGKKMRVLEGRIDNFVKFLDCKIT